MNVAVAPGAVYVRSSNWPAATALLRDGASHATSGMISPGLPSPRGACSAGKQILSFSLHSSPGSLTAPLPAKIEIPGIVRLGSLKGNRKRRAIALRFDEKVELLIGDECFELADLIQWDGDRLKLDLEELRLIADTTGETTVGGKRYQRSKITQQRRRERTAQRDKHLQEAADSLKEQRPGWSKPDIAQAILDMGTFENISKKRIARIIRVKYRKRKKIA